MLIIHYLLSIARGAEVHWPCATSIHFLLPLASVLLHVHSFQKELSTTMNYLPRMIVSNSE